MVWLECHKLDMDKPHLSRNYMFYELDRIVGHVHMFFGLHALRNIVQIEYTGSQLEYL